MQPNPSLAQESLQARLNGKGRQGNASVAVSSKGCNMAVVEANMNSKELINYWEPRCCRKRLICIATVSSVPALFVSQQEREKVVYRRKVQIFMAPMSLVMLQCHTCTTYSTAYMKLVQVHEHHMYKVSNTGTPYNREFLHYFHKLCPSHSSIQFMITISCIHIFNSKLH